MGPCFPHFSSPCAPPLVPPPPPPRQHEAGDSQVVSTDVWNENLDAAAAVVVHIQCANRNKKLLLAYM